MSSAPAKKYYTEDEYLAMEAKSDIKHEYLRGEIFAMSGGSANHSVVGGNLLALAITLLRGKPCTVYTSEMRVKVKSTGLYTYPDMSIACPPIDIEKKADGLETLLNPIVVVEVLSPSTESFDRGNKWLHYQEIPSEAIRQPS